MEAKDFSHPITVEEYERMAEAGVFGDARIELLNGELVNVPPQGPPHAGTTSYCTERFRAAFGTRLILRVQMPIQVGDSSEPEPDLVLACNDVRYYRDRHPRAEDVIAVVEVAASSVVIDRGVKRTIYGAGRIGEYWIVDLAGETIDLYREPHDLGYGWHAQRKRGQTVSFAAFPDVVFSVDELLG